MILEETLTEWLDIQRQRLEDLTLDAMIKLGEEGLQLTTTGPPAGTMGYIRP